jgi:hypothetical protein
MVPKGIWTPLLSDEPKNGDVSDAPILTLYLTSGQTDILAPIVPVAFYWEEFYEHVIG